MSECGQEYEAFFYACEGTQAELERVIKSSKEILHAKDHRGRNLLMYAAMGDKANTFQYLLKKSLSYLDVDNNGCTVLHWAVHCGSFKVVKHILATCPTDESSPCLFKDKDGVTPLHIAAGKSCSKMLKTLYESLTRKECVFEYCKDNRGRSFLHYAACAASIDCVNYCLDTEQGINTPVDARDSMNMTPLICAAGVDLPQSVDVCRALYIRKPVSVTHRNRDGLSALHMAVVARAIPIVQLLVDDLKILIDVIDDSGRTALHYAAEQGEFEICQILIARSLALLTKKDNAGATAIHYAAQSSKLCLDFLLREYESAFNKPFEINDNEGRSCFMWAICAGNEETIQYLMSKSSTNRTETDARGFSALHLAAMTGNEPVCKMLVPQGWSVTARDRRDNSALHLAAGRGHTEVVRALMTAGAEMNGRDAMGRTPIFWACFGGQAHTLFCMIRDMGFEWRVSNMSSNQKCTPITDNFLCTPLHAAAYAGFTQCINVLLMIEQEDYCLSQPFVAWKNMNGETALHIAVIRGKLDCAQLLFKGGAGLNALDFKERTPLDCAIEHKRQNIVDFLKSEGAHTRADLVVIADNIIKRFFARLVLMKRTRRQHGLVFRRYKHDRLVVS